MNFPSYPVARGTAMGLGSVIPNLALEALGRVSPATNRSSPLTMVCENVEGRTFERVRVAGHAPQPTSPKTSE